MTETISIKHSYNSGDLITILPGLQHIYKTTGKKTIVYQVIGFQAHYYDNALHPYKDNDGTLITMNEYAWEKLKPLLESQKYIERAERWTGQLVDINFDKTRDRHHIPLPNGDIHFWCFFIAPELQCDLSDKWITVSGVNISDKVIVNRTHRYTNPYISYYFLKQYEKDLLFGGTQEEYEKFCTQWQLDIPFLESKNFLELSEQINSCRFFLGNQSMCWHIADGLKKKRLLEICTSFPNTFPTGKDGYAFLYQEALELYFYKLYHNLV